MKTESIKQTGMKYSYLFFPMLIFLIFGLYSFFVYEPVQEVTSHPSQVSVSDLQDSIRALQKSVAALQDSVKDMLAKNPGLDLQMQVNHLENEVKITRDDARNYFNEYNDNTSNFLSKLSGILIVIGILTAIFGFLVPFLDKKELEKKIEYMDNNLRKVIEVQVEVNHITEEAKVQLLYMKALNEENIDKAIGFYNQCIKLNPTFAEAYKNLGILYFKKNITIEALENLNRAIIINKKIPEAFLYRGLLKYRLEGIISSKDDIQSAINLNPDYAEAYYIRALLAIEQKNIGISIKDFNKAKKLKYNVVESLPFRDQLTDNMRDLDEQIIENNYKIPEQYTE